ncbi:MAG: fused MFS/spermidine synthase, partial [Planctomycetota bacterium]
MRTNIRMLIYLLFLLSGCTGLIYEVVWVRKLILVLGGTTYAITTVLVAFMSGLALGSFLGGKISDGLGQPGRSYGLLEIGIGLYGLAVPLLLGAADPLYRTLYPHVAEMPWLLTGVRFLVGSIVLLLPTTCMGATLPILVRYATHEGQSFGKSVGRLYGINTLGAVLGTMAAGFWLIPAFGLTHTTWIAATVNLFIGLAAIIYLRSSPKPVKQVKPSTAKAKPTDLSREVTPNLRLAVLIGFAISGFAAMVYQIAWTRALIMSVGSSTYAFTCILAAFILGLAMGSLVIACWVDRWRRPVLVFGLLELGIGLSAILIVPIHGRIPFIVRQMVTQHAEHYNVLVCYQFALIIAVTFIPTFLGAIFPLVTRIVAVKDGESGSAVGRAYAVNTLGTIFGSFLAGFVLIRSNVLGIQNSIVAAALLNALVGTWLVVRSRPAGTPIRARLVGSITVVLLIPLISVIVGKWDRLLLNSAPYLKRQPFIDSEIVYFGEGVDTTVSVIRHIKNKHYLSMTLNGKTDASTGITDMPTQLLLGHLPALLTDDGKNACVIGLGSGITLSAVACYPSYERLDCVEISDEVIKAAEYFAP